MYYLVVAIHVVVCLFLIIVILLQSGKAADLAGAFGGMGSQTAFGPRGSATLLSKATTISAVVFMCTSLIGTAYTGPSACLDIGRNARSYGRLRFERAFGAVLGFCWCAWLQQQ